MTLHRWRSVRQQAAGRDLLLARVLCRGLLDHWRDHAVIAGIPSGDDLPVLACAGLDASDARAVVVGAGHFDRLQLVLEAKLLGPCRREVEVFEAPPDLLPSQWLLAEPLLRSADLFD